MSIRHKKLIISIATLGSGGAERVLSALSSKFADTFETVELILWKSQPMFYTIDSRITVTEIERQCQSNNEFKKIRWFREYIKQNQDAIILSFLYPYSIRVLLATIGLKNKIIVAERRDPKNVRGGYIVRKLRDLLYLNADTVLVQTPSNKHGYSGWLQSRIKSIPNPIDIDPSLQGYGLFSQKSNMIVSVGRLIPEKNQALLIKAFANFSLKYPDYKLIIYGTGTLQKNLIDLAQMHGVLDKLSLPGNKKEIIKRISSAKMFVLSSDSEGMPNALFEALAVGLPCISTRINAASDFIEDGKNGLLVDINNQEELTNAMLKIASDQSLANRLAKNAVKINTLLDKAKIGDLWIQSIN